VWGYFDNELQGSERVILHYTIPDRELLNNEDIRFN